MNSDMDNNSDVLYSRLIAWLLKESVTAATTPEHGQEQDTVPAGELSAADFELDQLDPLDLEEVNIAPFNTDNTAQFLTQGDLGDALAHEAIEPGSEQNPDQLGGMPIVQKRFEALLKRRLKVEIERHPPLFPWETEISDYESDTDDVLANRWVPPIDLWMPQLDKLALPVSLPENVLVPLLEACSEVVDSQLKLGRQMVNAVKNLFPDQFQSLDPLAGMVIGYGMGRNPDALQLPNISYDDASAEQRMTLALLAAKEIINTLSVQISPTKTPVERQWQTSAGIVSLKAHYRKQEEVTSVYVRGHLPRGGSLALQAPAASATSQRTNPGYLSVELFEVQPGQTYPLEVRFHESESAPLRFALCPTL